MQNKIHKLFMKKYIFIVMILTGLFSAGFACVENNIKDKSRIKTKIDTININNLKVKTVSGEDKFLSDYNGKVLLIVNVASKCGYTPQYEGLEAIYKKYKDSGFEILAFPCNDFKGQEPGTNEEIAEFCKKNYGVTFTVFDKIKILGDEKSELYSELIKFEPAGDVSLNFEKFVIEKNGNVVGRFKSKVKPESSEITSLIESELSK